MENTSVDDDVPVSTIKASSIQVIDKKSVHRICSGQVVLTLATAVKELVENSIDAGATSVEVKLKDYGSESIEVIDNGTGVEETNFEGLTLKHHTSKLTDFDDLVGVTTFGFRGEALSSLCALSNMTIITRHKSADVGTRLELDLNGKILSKKFTPKPVGTVVIVHNIFHSLPVRHKEFQRNIKREFARLIQVLNAYCIINTGVRISCVNQTSKGNRSTAVSTNCNASMRENISNVFGPKQLHSLLEFKQIDPKDEICSEYGVKVPQNSMDFSISGFVSKCEHGQGRSSGDRQFIFINKRPCDASKIIKLINEVYHMYNRHQFPFVSLSIEMKKESVDVNVTPDKRQIFMDGEKLFLVVLKSSLVEMFEPTSSVYKVNNNCIPKSVLNHSFSSPDSKTPVSSSSPSPFLQNSEKSLSSSLTKLKRSFSSSFDKNKDSSLIHHDIMCSNKKSKTLPLSSFNRSPHVGSITQYFSPMRENKLSVVLKSNEHGSSLDQHQYFPGSGDHMQENNVNDRTEDLKYDNTSIQKEEVKFPIKNTLEYGSGEDDVQLISEHKESSFTIGEYGDGVCGHGKEGIEVENVDERTSEKNFHHTETGIKVGNDFADGIVNEKCSSQNTPEVLTITPENFNADVDIQLGETHENEQEILRSRKETVVKLSLDELRNRMQRKSHNHKSTQQSFSRTFRAKISPGENTTAEEELQREISKDMFNKMEILGQFNLGFIITKLGSDLFIVDQHATDEKYNFEMLQKNHVLQSQKMIIPQNLELTSSNEVILLDNLEVFKKNGFDFLINTEAPPTQRVKLVSAPVSKNWSFGKDDIEELLFMLMDSPNVMCRPSRVRMMFASRACRKSIMIGTALNHNEMKRLVSHMGEIEQPWNCPHGRPTMRHLFNLNMLPS